MITKIEKLVEVELAYMVQHRPKLKFAGIDAQLNAATAANIISHADARRYRAGDRYDSLLKLHKKRQEFKRKPAKKVAVATA